MTLIGKATFYIPTESGFLTVHDLGQIEGVAVMTAWDEDPDWESAYRLSLEEQSFPA